MTEWIDIVEYRVFHDVPRIFLIDVGGTAFLFDCQFDDYPDEYKVYELGSLPLDALPKDWTGLSGQATRCKGRVVVRDVVFDVSKRRQVKRTSIQDFVA